MAACSGSTALTILAPGGTGPAFDYSRSTLAAWPQASTAKRGVATQGSALLAGRLQALYAEGAADLRPPDGAVAVTTGSVRAELEAIARNPDAVDSDRRHRIGGVARTLSPRHTPAGRIRHLASYLSSLTAPLLSHPEAAALRDLARAVGGGFGREPLLNLFRYPVFRLEGTLPKGTASEPSRWDRMARSARVEEGAEDWTESLPRWAEISDKEASGLGRQDPQDRLSAEALAGAVKALQREAARWEKCRTWSDHADFLRGLSAAHIDFSSPQGARVEAALQACCSELANLEAVDPALDRKPKPVGRAEALRARLEQVSR